MYRTDIINLLDHQQAGYAMLAVASATGILLITAIFMLHQNGLRKQRMKFIRQQLSLQQEHYRSVYNYLYDLETIRGQASELMKLIRQQLDEGSYDEALATVQEISCGIERSGSIQVCRNRMVNALLSHKYGEAEQQGIACDFEVTLDENSGIDDISLCGIFGNMMDNAIRACGELEAGRDKTISLKCAEMAGVLIIKEENPAPYGMELAEGSAPETTKPDKQNHGLGTKILTRAAARYGGTVEYSLKDNRFCVTMMLMPKRE